MRRYALTLDTDWAPDSAIDYTAQLLIDAQVKATWFVTHMSPAIERLRRHPELFELGIHPNFLPGSSHGGSPQAVLAHCMQLVPEARSMRTHALVQSTPLLDMVLSHTPIRCDVTLFLPYARTLELIDYQWKGQRLLRIPYFWEDDVEMLRNVPRWDAARLMTHCHELSVLAFHPIHVMLNSADMSGYETLKQRVGNLREADRDALRASENPGPGTASVFKGMLAALQGGQRSVRAQDLYSSWCATCD